MQPCGQGKSPLSVQCTFVAQFRVETDMKQGPIEGRAEHVASGQIVHFHSLDDLLTFMAQTLTSTRQRPSPGRVDKP